MGIGLREVGVAKAGFFRPQAVPGFRSQRQSSCCAWRHPVSALSRHPCIIACGKPDQHDEPKRGAIQQRTGLSPEVLSQLELSPGLGILDAGPSGLRWPLRLLTGPCRRGGTGSAECAWIARGRGTGTSPRSEAWQRSMALGAEVPPCERGGASRQISVMRAIMASRHCGLPREPPA
jgi:hypothetical protein